jgi:hypothetical protein
VSVGGYSLFQPHTDYQAFVFLRYPNVTMVGLGYRLLYVVPSNLFIRRVPTNEQVGLKPAVRRACTI